MMSIRTRAFVLLLSAALLPWLGLVQAIPHHHAESGVPQEELACSASRPSSHEQHLHNAGHDLAHHHCLVCLAGSFVSWVPGSVGILYEEEARPLQGSRPFDLRPRLRAELPQLRGPPSLI